MSSDDISERAEREREKQHAEQERVKAKVWAEARTSAPPPPVSADSRAVYAIVAAPSMGFAPPVIFALAAGVLTVAYVSEQRSPLLLGIGFGLAGLFALLVGAHLVRYAVGATQWKTWRGTLPFEFAGWELLGARSSFPAANHWDVDTRLAVTLAHDDAAARKAVADALFLLTAEANKCFYAQAQAQKGYGGDLRKRWASTELSAQGSADPGVIAELQRCVHRDLRSIHAKHPLARVEVHWSGQVIAAQPVEVSTD